MCMCTRLYCKQALLCRRLMRAEAGGGDAVSAVAADASTIAADGVDVDAEPSLVAVRDIASAPTATATAVATATASSSNPPVQRAGLQRIGVAACRRMCTLLEEVHAHWAGRHQKKAQFRCLEAELLELSCTCAPHRVVIAAAQGFDDVHPFAKAHAEPAYPGHGAFER